MLHSNSRASERILVIGGPGAGKSSCWVDIAKNLVDTPAKIYMGDTDLAFYRMIDPYPELESLFEQTDLEDWDSYKKFVESCKTAGNKDNGDWLTLDMIHSAWDEVQAEFARKVSGGKEIDQWFLDYKRSSGKDGSPMADAHGTNWGVVNKMYSKWIMTLLRFPSHILCCAPAEPVDLKNDSKELVDLFGKWQVKPKGQKSLPFQFHTVLLMKETKQGYTMTTIKDRNREKLVNAPVNSFVDDYLIKIAGWEK